MWKFGKLATECNNNNNSHNKELLLQADLYFQGGFF